MLNKIYEKLFFDKLVDFLGKNDILSSNKFGSRKNMSTVDSVTNLVEAVTEAFENREHTLSVFLDLSKAFDSADHEIPLYKLETCGVRTLSLEWLKAYLLYKWHVV